MKIAMVSDFYPPFIGGTYRYVQTLSRGLVKRGHEVVVYSIGNKYLNSFEKDHGVNVIRSEGFFQKIPFLFNNGKIRHPPPVQDFLITRELKNIIRERKPDIIHSHGWILYSTLHLKKELDIPLVATLHDFRYICPKLTLLNGDVMCSKPLSTSCVNCAKNMLGGLVKSLFTYYGVKLNKNKLKFVDKFIAVSSFTKEIYSKQLNLSEKDVVVLPNFYEVETKELRSKKAEMSSEDFVLFVGALSPFKGKDVLINAYKRINTETKLVLIGYARQHYSHNDNENIQIITNAPHEMVMNAYPRCKFVVIPSICPEACPTVALEAMSCKKAIVASDIGGLRDIVVDGKTGILVPPNNPHKLASAMKYLIDNPKECIRMGERGYKHFINSLTVEKISEKVEKVYQDVMRLRN